MIPDETAELKAHERLQDAYTHLSCAGTELRNAMQAALNADADAPLFAAIGRSMQEVKSAAFLAMYADDLRNEGLEG